MSDKKKSSEKTRLHPRNKHREQYDLKLLTEIVPELSDYIAKNKYGNDTVDFFNSTAVTALNKALLMRHYGIQKWDLPRGYLCPPIPGRADYIHYIADILTGRNFGKIPTGAKVRCLDIGTGANCVYPIIGNSEYGWSFVGTDIDPIAIASAEKIVNSNSKLKGNVEIRLQPKKAETFFGIIKKDERYDLTICNPPFHSSPEDALEGSKRKLKNLKGTKVDKVELNFGGTSNELWTEGGEKAFILRMIQQSSQFAKSCCWFSTIVSKQSNLNHIKAALEKIGVMEQKTIPMGQGNKTSRIVAWTFLKKFEQKEWASERWAEVTDIPVKSKEKATTPKKTEAIKEAKVPVTKRKETAVTEKVVEKEKKAPSTKKKESVKVKKTPVVKKKTASSKDKVASASVKATAPKSKALVKTVKAPVEKTKATPSVTKKVAVKKKATVVKKKVEAQEEKTSTVKPKVAAPVKKAAPVKVKKVPAVKAKAAEVKEKKEK